MGSLGKQGRKPAVHKHMCADASGAVDTDSMKHMVMAMVAVALVLASVTGLIASFAPALRAARLDPVVAIRG